MRALIAVARAGSLTAIALATLALAWPPASIAAWLSVSIAALAGAVVLGAVIVRGLIHEQKARAATRRDSRE